MEMPYSNDIGGRKMVKIAIVGATGYTGVELVRLLSRHPEVEIVALTSQTYVGQAMAGVYPSLLGQLEGVCREQDLETVVSLADVIFVALPHGHAGAVAGTALAAGKKVIDLGADFRLVDAAVYRQWYQLEAPSETLLTRAVYGLPEIHREEIKKAAIVANPGCYPTSTILALAPALSRGLIDPATLIIDAKSGVSGAGRKLTLNTHYPEINEGIHPYGVGNHRHTPEIEQELSKLAGEAVTVSFTPHLLPMTRGILTTIYATLTASFDEKDLRQIYTDFYRQEPFVHVLPSGEWPHTKWTYGANYCYLGLTVDRRTGRLIVAAAIDNLVKGASGQAVQNMNLVCGFSETTGLEFAGIYP
jgi:N-acetyl-gamma-glutamyl-phosphate reductase